MSLLKITEIGLALFINSFGLSQKIAGVLDIKPGIEEGYTLFAPLNSNITYLIDNCGRIINTWESEFTPGNTTYLLPNGNLLRTKKLSNTIIDGGGGGGGIELFDWESNLLWSYELNNENLRLHHDVESLPNGNILMIVWELKYKDEAIEAGRDPALISSDEVIWSEQIIEIKPISTNSHEVVWKWSLWDHLIQDFDSDKEGFGIVSDHPELVNINYVNQGDISDWVHANSIDFNEALNQVVLSSPFFNEFWIIDHSTTTEEAASHSGGNFNKGGDLIYRWGNPLAYKRGTVEDQQLFGQHDVHWIDEMNKYEGSIILFNNNRGEKYSTVEIVTPSFDENSEYELVESSYGPIAPNFIYKANPAEIFHSRIMGGVQSLPNNNLLICSSLQGLIFEVTNESETVWIYKSPITANGIVGRNFEETNANFASDNNFRAIKYSKTYSAFDNKELTPLEPIEGEPWIPCNIITNTMEDPKLFTEVYPNPVKDRLYIETPDSEELLLVKLITTHGKIIRSAMGRKKILLNVSTVTSGLYVLQINNKLTKIIEIK